MVFMKTLLFYYNAQKYTEKKTTLHIINKDRPSQKHDVCSMKYGRKV